MKKHKCDLCKNNLWVMIKNLYSGKEFAVRCVCMSEIDQKRKNYKDFIEYNSQKYMLLDDYIEQYGQDSPPLKDGELSDMIALIMLKAENWKKERE